MRWGGIHKASPNKYDLKNCNYKKTDNKYANYSKYIIKKPWGHEYLIYQNKNVSIWILNISSKKYTSLHAHKLKETYLIPLTNKIRLNTFEKLFYLNKKDPLLIDKKVFHQSYNPGPKSEFMMEIELPNLKNDIIRFHDYYGRKDNDFSKENKSNIKNLNKKIILQLNKSKTIYFNREKIFFIKFNKNLKSLKNINHINNYKFFILLSGECEVSNKFFKKIIPMKLLSCTNFLGFEFKFNKNTVMMFI